MRLKKLKWYYNRLKLMSVREILFYRVPQFLQYRFLGKRQLNKNYNLLEEDIDFQFITYSKKNIAGLFKENQFQENYPVFDVTVNIEQIENWRRDFSSGKISPIHYYGDVERQNFKTNGDVKYLSELSRMEFLPFWAFQYVHTSDEFYRQKITEILRTWNIQNPYLKSIHWTSGIEVAIRSVNLIYTLLILKNFDVLSKEIKAELYWQVTHNYHFLKNHLSKYSSANNHRMAELMGLNVIASCFLVKKNEQEKWLNLFFAEVEKQINPDGVHNELCSQYHAEVLDQILITQQFLKATDGKIPYQVSELTKKMFEFNAHLVSAEDEAIFGDNDEGSIINPYFDEGFNLFKSQLATANHIFKTSYSSTGKLDFRNYLIFGEAYRTEKHSPVMKDRIFDYSGYGFFYDPQKLVKLSFDVGKMGDSISAAHAHSDILHFNFSKNGVPFFIDPGTFQYHSKDLFWRNYFRSISAHNTISINKKEHAEINGRMNWLKMPNTKIGTTQICENSSTCNATINASKKDGVIHKREFLLDRQKNKVEIKDVLSAKNNREHQLDFYLQLHPDIKIQRKAAVWKLRNGSEKISLENKYFAKAQIIEGDESEPLGWFSPQFGRKQKGKCLHLKLCFLQELKLLTVIDYDG